MLVRDELDRIFESIMTEVCGIEFDPDAMVVAELRMMGGVIGKTQCIGGRLPT